MATDPKSLLISFPLNVGMDNSAFEEAVQPTGEAPKLVRSVNTRLTKKRGIVSKAPGTTAITSGNNRMGGLVPAGTIDSSVLFVPSAEGGSKRIAGTSVGSLNAVNTSAEPQSSFMPARISRAGGLPAGAISFQTPATCWDESTGYTYYASLVEAPGGTSAIAITVIADDGKLIVSPTQVVSFSGTPNAGRFVALSVHGAGVVRLWYKASATNAILGSTVTVSSSTLEVIVGAPVTIYTPSTSTQRSIAIAYDPDDPNPNLYMVCHRDDGSFDSHLMRINAATMTVAASLNHNSGGDGNSYRACAYIHDGTSGRFIWMISWPAGNCTLVESDATTLMTTWVANTRMWYGGNISCGFYRSLLPTAIDHAVFAASKSSGSLSNTAEGGTKVEVRRIGDGNLLVESTLPWHWQIAQIATHKTTNTEYHPLLTVQPIYDFSGRYFPGNLGYVSDPSIEVYRPHYNFTATALFWSCLARVGTDFCIRYSSYNSSNACFGGCNNLVMANNVAKLCYLAENIAEGVTLNGHVPRYVDIDFSPSQPSFSHLASGQAIIPGALPVVFDGSEITELSPMRAPKIYGTLTGGSGSSLTGTFLFAAIYSWKDAAGVIHRSPPSNEFELVCTSDQIALYVTKPVSYRNGTTQGPVEITIYASQDGEPTLYAQSTYVETLGSSTDFWAAFEAIFTPSTSVLNPALYTGGGPDQIKPSFCPNACTDAAVIGDRVYLLDAERPARSFYSLPMSTGPLQGFFPSFSSDDYTDFPASAGSLVAITNFRESPLYLTSNGVWTINGEGPDALGNGAPFSQPMQLSDYPCTSRLSVLKTPAGIIFLSGDQFVLFNGEARLLTSLRVTETIVGTGVFKNQHEAVWYLSDGRAWVYNYLADAFTYWDRDCISGGSSVTFAAQIPASGKVFYCSPGTTVSWLMDPSTVSTSAQIVLETGWILMGGPQDDNRLSNVLTHCYKGGSHGLTVSIATNYDVAQPVKSYSNAELVTVNNRLDVSTETGRDMKARAAKLIFTETGATGEGFQPINCTLEILKNPGKMADAIKKSWRK